MKLLPLKADSSISLSTKYRRDVGYNSYNPDFSSAWARPLIETRIYGKIRFLYHMNVSCFLSWAKYRGVFRARSTDGDVSRNICFQLKSFVAFVDCEFIWSLTAWTTSSFWLACKRCIGLFQNWILRWELGQRNSASVYLFDLIFSFPLCGLLEN